MVSGGFPCQAFSTAARGRNKPEKDLWLEMRRVYREVEPMVVFAENVSEKAIQKAGQDLRDDGYNTKHIQLSAKDMGADHNRRRHWLLAYTDHYGELLRQQYAETQGVQELQSRVWESYTGEPRMVDGFSNRMDRIRATGNGQVPVVAASAFIRLNREIIDD